MNFPFVGGAYTGRSPAANAQECVNLFPQVDQEGGAVLSLYGTPGLETWLSGLDGPVRGMHVARGVLYVAAGDHLYRVTTSGAATSLGQFIESQTAPVSIADNGNEVLITDNIRGYIYDMGSDVFEAVRDGDFPVATSCCFIDGYFIVAQKLSQKFWISGLYDGHTWDGLDFAQAEGAPDQIVRVVANHRELWAFGEHSTEIYLNTGDSGFPFERISGGYMETGCAAPWSVAVGDHALFWLSQDLRGQGLVYMARGYQPVRISTHQIEHQISQYSRISDAQGFVYQDEGHTFYVLTFPTGDATRAYDLATGMWHRRSSGLEGGRHLGAWHAFYGGQHLLGSAEAGKIYKQSLDVYGDDGDPIRRVRSTRTVNDEGRRVRFNELRVDMEEGAGIASGQGADPQAMLEWSDDGGRTWSNEHWTGFGRQGQYGRRAVWRRLGMGRDRVFRVTITDPVPVVITGAHLDARGGTS